MLPFCRLRYIFQHQKRFVGKVCYWCNCSKFEGGILGDSQLRTEMAEDCISCAVYHVLYNFEFLALGILQVMIRCLVAMVMLRTFELMDVLKLPDDKSACS